MDMMYPGIEEVVHRDQRSSSVMVDESGAVYLVGFGWTETQRFSQDFVKPEFKWVFACPSEKHLTRQPYPAAASSHRSSSEVKMNGYRPNAKADARSSRRNAVHGLVYFSDCVVVDGDKSHCRFLLPCFDDLSTQSHVSFILNCNNYAHNELQNLLSEGGRLPSSRCHDCACEAEAYYTMKPRHDAQPKRRPSFEKLQHQLNQTILCAEVSPYF
ncbi:unnamed protein product [Taenia asiatica]|uniref:Protein kinase domain-containing protein n=1 Tax=Taenia asiatica TaxID=60517 RepID=A0A0R3VZA4_TAEAS|nr:unnamed protein product [Taenia asiatica]